MAKIRLAYHYLDVVNHAIDRNQVHALDIDWLQIKDVLEYGRGHFTLLNTTYRNQQWKPILYLTRSVCQTNGYLSISGYWEESQLYLKVAIQAAVNLQDTKILHELTLSHARILYRLGKIDEATKDFEYTLHTLQNENDLNKSSSVARQIAAIHEQLGMIAVLSGKYETAKKHLDKSLRIRIELEAPKGLEFTYSQLGNLATAQEEYNKAYTYIRQALHIQEKQNALPLDLARTLRQLCKISLLQQMLPEAREYGERSLEIAQEYKDQHGIANDLTRLGILSHLENDLDKAQKQLDDSLQIRNEIGDLEGKIATLNALSEVAYKKSNIAQAHSFYQQGVQISKSLNAPKEQATSTYQMGTLAYFDNDLGTAWPLYEQSLASLAELGTLPLSWRAHRKKHKELREKREEYTRQLDDLKKNPAPLWHSAYPHRGWIVGAGVGWWISRWLINYNSQFVSESDLVTYLVGCCIGATLGLLLGILFKIRERNQFTNHIQGVLNSFQEMASQSLDMFPHMGEIKSLDIGEKHLQFFGQELEHIRQLMLSEEDTQPWLDLYEPYGAAIGLLIGLLFGALLGWSNQNPSFIRLASILFIIGYGIGNRYKAHTKRQLPHEDEPINHQTQILNQADLHSLQIISDHNWLRIISEGCGGNINSLWSYEDRIFYQIDQLEDTEDMVWQATVIRNLADIAFEYEDYDQAKYFYQRSLSLMQTLNNHEEIAKTFHQLGNLAYCLSKFEEAQDFYARSLKMRQELDDIEGIIATVSHLAHLAVRIKKYETAREKYQYCFALQESRNDLVGLMQSFEGMSVVARRLNDLVDARKFSERHLTIATELKNRKEASLAHASLAKITYLEGMIEEAESHFHSAIELSTEKSTRSIEQLNLALAYAQQKRFIEAIQLLEFIRLTDFGMSSDFTKVIMKLHDLWREEANKGFWGRLKLYYQFFTGR